MEWRNGPDRNGVAAESQTKQLSIADVGTVPVMEL